MGTYVFSTKVKKQGGSWRGRAKETFYSGSGLLHGASERKKEKGIEKYPEKSPANVDPYFYPLIYPGPDFPRCARYYPCAIMNTFYPQLNNIFSLPKYFLFRYLLFYSHQLSRKIYYAMGTWYNNVGK